MRLVAVRRTRVRPWMRAGAPVGASLRMVAVGGLFFAALGKDPFAGYHAFFVAPVSSVDGLSELALKASPLILIALGLAPGFRSGVWNIGAEGQLILGAIAASAVAIAFEDASGPFVLPLMLTCAAAAGAAWAGIAAWLKVRWNTNEILVTLMLVYVATNLLNFMIYGPMKDPRGMGFPQSILFGDAAVFAPIDARFRLNWSILITLAAVPLLWVFLQRSFAGYQLAVGGLAPHAARYAGFSTRRAIWTSLLVGGALAGLAGAIEVAGPLGQLTKDVSRNYGFAAIIVAFLGRLHPIGIVAAGLLMSLLYIGGEKAQITMDLPSAVTGLFQGLLLLFLLACDFLTEHRLRWRARVPLTDGAA